MCRWSLNFFFLALNIHSKGHEWSGREDTVSWRFRNVRRSFHGWTFRVSQKNNSSGVFQHRQNLSHQHKNLTTSETTLQHISLNISHSLMWSQTKLRSPPEFRWGGVTQWIVKASEIQKFEMINDLFASNSASHVLILGKNSPSLRAWNKSFHPATSTSMYIHLRFTLLLASVFYQMIWLQSLKRNREKESASSLYNNTGYMSYIKVCVTNCMTSSKSSSSIKARSIEQSSLKWLAKRPDRLKYTINVYCLHRKHDLYEICFTSASTDQNLTVVEIISVSK